MMEVWESQNQNKINFVIIVPKRLNFATFSEDSTKYFYILVYLDFTNQTL
jgi:hypothetical protein